LSSSLTAERDDVSYEALARQLGAGAAEIKGLLHRLRQRYRQLLREAVAATVAQAGDVDDELRYLVAALAASNTQRQEEERL
jgi:RNA polymerase sigma-70 factor (ECF subfamily)